MRDTQYFSKLPGFLSWKRGRTTARGATRRLSPFKIESLEPRILLSADLGSALSVAEILNSPTVGNQQAVVQNVQASQPVVASTSTTPAPPPPTTSVSANWYVSTTGSDSGTGRTVDTPFRTISNAVSVARPGDVILVRGGVYSEYVTIANSGTSSSPITLASYPGETAILDGSSRTPNPNIPITNYSGRQPRLLLVTGSHVIVKDLEIRNSADIGVEVDGNNVLLDHLHVHDTYYAGVTFWASQESTVQNSTVHDAFDNNSLGDSGENADGINAGGFSTRLTIRNNECYHDSDDGIDLGNSTNVLVEGNHLHHNGYGLGGDGEGAKVLNGTNNTLQNNIAHDQRIGFDSGESGGNFFYNNTAYNNYQTNYIEYYGNTSVNTGNSWN